MNAESLEVVQWIHCENATEFLDELSPRHSRFGRKHALNFRLFRGNGSIEQKLIPNALRPDALGELHSLARSSAVVCEHPESNANQIRAETSIIKDFLAAADAHGLPLPEDSQRLRLTMDAAASAALMWSIYEAEKHDHSVASQMPALEWPKTELLSLIALAQHHGLPTRLLDWSRSAYIAAYFAATWSIREHQANQDHRFCVWSMFSLSFFGGANLQSVRSSDTRTVTLVTAPRAGNANLHAQKGAFTLTNYGLINPYDKPDRRCLTELIREDDVPQSLRPCFRVFTLPAAHAGEVLYLLHEEGVSAASMFPGYKGAVDAVRERLHWNSSLSTIATEVTGP